MICTEHAYLDTHVSCQKPMQHSRWVGFYSVNLSTPSLLCHYANNTRLACAKVPNRLSNVLTYCGAHGTALSSGADLWVCIRIGVNGGPLPTYSARLLPWELTIRKKKLQKQSTVHSYTWQVTAHHQHPSVVQLAFHKHSQIHEYWLVSMQHQ